MIKQNIIGPLREQSDWEQNDENRLGFIKNKPFYDTCKTESLTIEWDGVIEGRETNNFIGQRYVKLSDATPTYEEIIKVTVRTNPPTSKELEVFDFREEGVPVIGAVYEGAGIPICIFILDNFELDGEAYNKGIYSCWLGDANGDGIQYVEYLQLPSVTTGELKTIDEKYLPNGCKPKEIDIADDIPNGLFIGEYIYQLFVKGGGTKIENVGDDTRDAWNDFFNQFEENRPYTFVLPIVSIGAVLKTQQINVNMTKAGVGEIVCTFLSNQNGTMMRIICSMMRMGDTAILFSVVVEPLAIPSATV